MNLLFDLTRAAGEHASDEWMREFNRAYSDAENFLAANGRPTSEYARPVDYGNPSEDDAA